MDTQLIIGSVLTVVACVMGGAVYWTRPQMGEHSAKSSAYTVDDITYTVETVGPVFTLPSRPYMVETLLAARCMLIMTVEEKDVTPDFESALFALLEITDELERNANRWIRAEAS